MKKIINIIFRLFRHKHKWLHFDEVPGSGDYCKSCGTLWEEK